MCDIMEKRFRERDLETAKNYMSLGKLSLEEIAKASNLPLSTVKELASSVQKKAGA